MKYYANEAKNNKDMKQVDGATKQENRTDPYGYKRSVYVLVGTIVAGLCIIIILKLAEM